MNFQKKYGSKAMKEIRYAKDGSIDERNNATGLNVLSGIGAGMTLVGAQLIGAPVAFAIAPVFRTNKEKGYELQAKTRQAAYKELKPKK